MKRQLLVTLQLLLVSIILNAQDKTDLYLEANDVFYKFIKYSDFINRTGRSYSWNESNASEFQNLFVSKNSKYVDEIYYTRADDDQPFLYETIEGSVSEVLNKIEESFKTSAKYSYQRNILYYKFDFVDNSNDVVIHYKTTTFLNYNNRRIGIKAEFKIYMVFVKSKGVYKISSVENVKEKAQLDIYTGEDYDKDGFNDDRDDCPRTSGSLNGCPKPPAETDFMASINFGLSSSTGIANLSNNLSAVDFVELNRFDFENYGSVDRAPISFGFDLGLEREMGYSTTKKSYTNMIGFSIGLRVTSFNSLVYLDHYRTWYQAFDWESTSFQRIATARNVKERISYTSVGLPISLSYRKLFFDPNNKQKPVSLFISGVVQPMRFNSNSSIITRGTADYEALYTWQGSGFGFEDHSGGELESAEIWKLSRQGQLTRANYIDYINSEASGGDYKVGIDVPLTDQVEKSDNFYGSGLIVNLNLGFSIAPKESNIFSNIMFNYNSFSFNFIESAQESFIDGMEDSGTPMSMMGESTSLLNLTNAHGSTGLGFNVSIGYKF